MKKEEVVNFLNKQEKLTKILTEDFRENMNEIVLALTYLQKAISGTASSIGKKANEYNDIKERKKAIEYIHYAEQVEEYSYILESIKEIFNVNDIKKENIKPDSEMNVENIKAEENTDFEESQKEKDEPSTDKLVKQLCSYYIKKIGSSNVRKEGKYTIFKKENKNAWLVLHFEEGKFILNIPDIKGSVKTKTQKYMELAEQFEGLGLKINILNKKKAIANCPISFKVSKEKVGHNIILGVLQKAYKSI